MIFYDRVIMNRKNEERNESIDEIDKPGTDLK